MKHHVRRIALLVALPVAACAASGDRARAAGQAAPAPPALDEADPPREMIDFPGRREQCADYAPDPGAATEP